MHFFNPAPLMPLVEIVRAERTSADVFEAAFELGARRRLEAGRPTAHPARALAFTRAPLRPRVETGRAERTSAEVFEAAFELGVRLGKTPIRCTDTPGFV